MAEFLCPNCGGEVVELSGDHGFGHRRFRCYKNLSCELIFEVLREEKGRSS